MNCCRSRLGARVGLFALAVLLCSIGLGASDATLANSAEKADWGKVRALVTQRVDVNTPQVDGMTALHWAAYHDSQEIADLLVRAGANVKAANRYGVTPLSLACTNGDGAMVESLLKAG